LDPDFTVFSAPFPWLISTNTEHSDSIVRGIDFGLGHPLKFRITKKVPAFCTIVPFALVLIIVVKMADALVFMLKLAASSPSIGHIGRITAD